MGLFGSGIKERRLFAEAAVSQAVAAHPTVELILRVITNPPTAQTWLNTVCGYYDSRVRTVVVDKDMLGIMNCQPQDRKNPASKHEFVKVVFTELGYTPLPPYQDSDGSILVETKRVAELLATEVRNKIRERCPVYALSDVTVETDEYGDFETAYFTYRLPALAWKSWF